MLDWDDLRFFLAVARHRTLAAAARHLGVTQSTVSRRITALQQDMGVLLLNRTADGYVLTLAGESIRSHVERVETETLAVERAVTGHDVRLAGIVRVASSQLLASHILAACYTALQATHSEIVVEAWPEADHASPAPQDADIVVRLRPFEHPDLIVRNVGTIGFGLYGAPAYLGHADTPEIAPGLAGHRLITQLDEREMSTQAQWLAQHASQATVTFKADSTETQQWAAYCAGGLAVLPRFRADAEPGLQWVPVEPPVPPANVWLGVHRDSRKTPRIRAVLDCIADGVRRRATQLNPASS